jgi:predicted nucleic acid-binding protein
VIVVDASLIIDVLMATPAGRAAAQRLALHIGAVQAPHLIDLETAQTLRRFERAGRISPSRALQAMDIFVSLRMRLHQHRRLLSRVWQLRHTVSAYDAAYVALAEALDCPLVTTDARLAQSHGHTARIELIEAA